MKKGRTLESLASELKSQNESKEDYLADTRRLRLAPQAEGVNMEIDNVGSFAVAPHTHRQIGERCKVPSRYYDRMLASAPDLLAHNINHWFDHDPERRMVRTLYGGARAFLSDRYRPLDHYDLANVVLPELGAVRADVVSCEVTDRKLYIKAIVPGVQEEIGPPEGFAWGEGHVAVDVVQPGLVVSNSEIGVGALAVEPAVHTEACSNLSVWSEKAYRKYHLGGKQTGGDDVWQYLSAETKDLTAGAIWAQVRDLVRQALQGNVFGAIVDELKAARGHAIEGDPVEAVTALGEEHRLTHDERQDVLHHLIRGGDLTQYGMHSAITRTSNDAEDYDRASDLEALGGTVVRLPAKDWARIAQAT